MKMKETGPSALGGFSVRHAERTKRSHYKSYDGPRSQNV